MLGENQRLVTDELVEFENKLVEVREFMRITDHYRGIYIIYFKCINQNRKIMSTCNRLDLDTLRSWPTMPKNFPGTVWNHPVVLSIPLAFSASRTLQFISFHFISMAKVYQTATKQAVSSPVLTQMQNIANPLVKENFNNNNKNVTIPETVTFLSVYIPNIQTCPDVSTILITG